MLLNACVSIGLCQCVSFACLACEPLNWKTAYSTETDESTLKVRDVIFFKRFRKLCRGRVLK